jgi:hypothetical protein
MPPRRPHPLLHHNTLLAEHNAALAIVAPDTTYATHAPVHQKAPTFQGRRPDVQTRSVAELK